MLLRPSNTLLLDEPTNHLDIDSKEVLLDALVDYGGTLIFVSHDRYFVEKLATKIIDVGDGKATMYPGTYEAFLWSREHGSNGSTGSRGDVPKGGSSGSSEAKPKAPRPKSEVPGPKPQESYEDRKREQAEKKKRERAYQALKTRVAEMEARIAEREQQIKELEQTMAAPDFYTNHEKSKPVLDRHQALMWEVGELLGQWEMLQSEAEQFGDPNRN